MLKRLNATELLAVLMQHIEERTGIPVYDNPENKKSPFYAFEYVTSKPVETKTMFMDEFEVPIHAISAPPSGEYSIQPILDLVEKLQSALTEEICLPEPFRLINQEDGGIQAMKRDPSGEGHAIVNCTFQVCYAYKVK